jgi:predicted RNA binding protein with dsRBD fold (UPF0201 family)
MIHVDVSAPVFSTEDPEKVIRAISALFTDIKIEREDIKPSEPETGILPSSLFSGKGGIDLLLTLHGLIRREEIIDSVRNKALNAGLSADGLSVRFLLNKQAALVGIPSIPAQIEPLGSIEVVIKANSHEEMKRLFEWLLPPTEDGRPVGELEMEYVENNERKE